MICLECNAKGQQTPALGLCHCCFAALCSAHARVRQWTLETTVPVSKTLELPLPARRILCKTCEEALAQLDLPRSYALAEKEHQDTK